jgi:hypothetical protein
VSPEPPAGLFLYGFIADTLAGAAPYGDDLILVVVQYSIYCKVISIGEECTAVRLWIFSY